MSIILIDAGNSCLKYSVLESISEPVTDSLILDYSNLSQELRTELENLVVTQVFVSSVSNPLVFHTIADIAQELWRIEPLQIVVEQNSYGLSTRYQNPRLLGSDRWLAMIAAHDEFPDNICVVDCGTAVTVDVVTDDGMHLGGLITPGLKTARDSLGMQTSNLPFIENNAKNYNNNSSLLANNTHDAILGGTLYQISAYIERIVADIRQEFGDNTQCIITGGDAEQIQQLSMHQFHYREMLVLEGLRIVAEQKLNKECL